MRPGTRGCWSWGRRCAEVPIERARADSMYRRRKGIRNRLFIVFVDFVAGRRMRLRREKSWENLEKRRREMLITEEIMKTSTL